MMPFESAAPPPPTGFRALLHNLVAGLRATFLLSVREDRVRASFSQFIALALIGVAWPFAVEIVRSGFSGRLYPGALPDALFDISILLIASWAIAWIARRPDRTLLVAVVALAADVWIGAVDWVLVWTSALAPHGAPQRMVGMALTYAPPLWLALATALAAVRLVPIFGYRRAIAVLLAAALVALPTLTAWPDRQLWSAVENEAPPVDGRNWRLAGSEDVLYSQPKLLERALAAIGPSPADEPSLFFVGVAGYADQDVFMREVESVAQLFDERFGTRGHSVVLINNRKRLFDTPIATMTSLRAVLKRVSEVMHDHDVLFLYLSSHGSRDHRFSLSMWPLTLRDLDATTLRAMLDEAGIRNRVVVVSACYSGGFVAPLKDDSTLVITAAAEDRNSFGCSNEADFTYFGKAYFDDALRQTYSFIDAFDRARPEITAREKKEGYDPSDPQIAIGRNVGAILEPLERRWATASAATPGKPSATEKSEK